MKDFVILIKRKSNSKVEVASTSISEGGAEGYAQGLYHDLQLDLVMVAEVIREPLREGGVKYRKIMKIERTCKHPNIQNDYILGGMACMNCGMVIKPLSLSSKVEQTFNPVTV